MESIIIRDFFITFLEEIVEEVETQNFNSDLIYEKIQCYNKFTCKYSDKILDNNDTLSKYNKLFDLISKKNNLVLDKKTNFINSYNLNNPSKYVTNTNNYYEIDEINKVILTLFVHFFKKNIDLFQELQNSFEEIEEKYYKNNN